VLDLTRRETDLLEQLLRAAGRAVVKDVLEDRMYSAGEPVTANALEAAVSRLRKRLASAGAGVRVETKRGIGYRLVVGGGTREVGT
jgi:DNA-binding response OmpR family regulator